MDLRTDNDDDVTHGGASRADFYKAAQRSNQEEDLRLLYVAMTRAKHRCVVYMQQTDELPTAAVGLLFHPPQPPEDEMLKGHHRLDFIRTELSKKAKKIEPEVLEAELKAWNAVIGPYGERLVIGVRTCTYGDLARAPQYARLDKPPSLKTRIFSRNGLEHYWQRSSYSALTRSAHGAVDGLHDDSSWDPTQRGTDRGVDESEDKGHQRQQPPLPPAIQNDSEVILKTFPGGVEPVLCMHGIFEDIDFERLRRCATNR